MDESGRRRGSWLVSKGAMVVGVLAWLWPIGLGGQMPTGGDATQFSMGLMAFFRSSIKAGRLPLWNDLWGFGFPGLAESQMGVFYPPHLLLYGLLPVEVGYTSSLVLHTLWGAFGAAWAARRFGISEPGSALAGFAWATSGFFLIHLPHQWGYTVGSWMPWAWGLAWQVSRRSGTRRTPWILILVLTLQVLPGHFQLAFITQVSVLLIALASGRGAIRASVVVSLSVVGMIPMAAMQLLPTFELAQLSGSTRGFEYLSGFAATPLHLISYVAPGLFHRSPLWRPLAWDVFHTAPEEHLAFIGLAPLFLALLAIARLWKADAGVRALIVVALVTMLLSLGPYVPGFEGLIHLPGFSFFRAPARWGLGTCLALAVLAGKGFDLVQSGVLVARSLVGFCLAAFLSVAVVIGGFELALASSRGAGLPVVASGFDRALKLMPWTGDPPFRAVMTEAYKPQFDLRVQAGLARIEGRVPAPPGPTLVGDRLKVYRLELGESAAILVGLLLMAAASRKTRIFAMGLVSLAAADAFLVGLHRPFDLGPVRSLVGQSPVLARVAEEGRGVRTLDPGQNLFLVARADSAQAYRTLDLPSPGGLLTLARGPSSDPHTLEALRVAGIELRVLDPFESRSSRAVAAFTPPGWTRVGQPIEDPALAGWIYGRDLTRNSGLIDFTLLQPPRAPGKAWLIPSVGLDNVPGMTNPMALLGVFRGANPLLINPEGPERTVVEVRVFAPGGSMVVLSRTYDPEWRGYWSSEAGNRPAKIVKVLGGWQGVEVPGPGRWTLILEYEGRAARRGLLIASAAWSVWFVGFFGVGWLRRLVTSERGGSA